MWRGAAAADCTWNMHARVHGFSLEGAKWKRGRSRCCLSPDRSTGVAMPKPAETLTLLPGRFPPKQPCCSLPWPCAAAVWAGPARRGGAVPGQVDDGGQALLRGASPAPVHPAPAQVCVCREKGWTGTATAAAGPAPTAASTGLQATRTGANPDPCTESCAGSWSPGYAPQSWWPWVIWRFAFPTCWKGGRTECTGPCPTPTLKCVWLGGGCRAGGAGEGCGAGMRGGGPGRGAPSEGRDEQRCIHGHGRTATRTTTSAPLPHRKSNCLLHR